MHGRHGLLCCPTPLIDIFISEKEISRSGCRLRCACSNLGNKGEIHPSASPLYERGRDGQQNYWHRLAEAIMSENAWLCGRDRVRRGQNRFEGRARSVALLGVIFNHPFLSIIEEHDH
ncbi:hypothetical protein KP509_06G034200 [Ceratopteris richardii]|uniref:Uncharacterized protein n=1 Tax=Ceratopteris richardii TaxID=49495 RepID=A0A8T2UJR7_CERRI|nr:hypothetical protein KP509_06G034200 [Ceratopteris richardii]